MNDFNDFVTVYPCKLGCSKLDDAGNEIPLPGSHEGYCERCHGAIVAGLEMAAPLIFHLLSMVPSALRSKPASDGSQRTKAATAPLPFDVNARDDAERIYRVIVGARFIPFGQGDLLVRATVRASTERRLLQLDDWLARAEVDAVGRFKADMQHIRRTALRWPTQDKPRFSSTTICPLDGERILIVPPLEPGADRQFVCSVCGNMLTEAEHEQYGRYLKAMLKSKSKVPTAKAHTLSEVAA